MIESADGGREGDDKFSFRPLDGRIWLEIKRKADGRGRGFTNFPIEFVRPANFTMAITFFLLLLLLPPSSLRLVNNNRENKNNSQNNKNNNKNRRVGRKWVIREETNKKLSLLHFSGHGRKPELLLDSIFKMDLFSAVAYY